MRLPRSSQNKESRQMVGRLMYKQLHAGSQLVDGFFVICIGVDISFD